MNDTVIAPRCSEPLADPCPYTAINGTGRCLEHAVPIPDPDLYAGLLVAEAIAQLGVTPAGDAVFARPTSWWRR